ncbi:unnamed protein product [Urochloa humidicola]
MASSRSSSSRASSSTQRGGGEMERLRSPVPYRVGPLEYSPVVKCRCNRKAPCWTSWSDDNPGRRYYRCPFGMRPGDCGYFVWIDREATPYERTLLCDLRDAIWKLRREKAEVDEKNAELTQVIEMAHVQNAELRRAMQQLQKEKDELKEKMDQTEARRMKQGNNCCFLSCIVVVVVIGFFCMLMWKA